MVNEGDKNSAPSGGGVRQTLQTAGTRGDIGNNLVSVTSSSF